MSYLSIRKYACVFIEHENEKIVDLMFKLLYKNWLFLECNEEVIELLWDRIKSTDPDNQSFDVRVTIFNRILQYEVKMNKFMNEQLFNEFSYEFKTLLINDDVLFAFIYIITAYQDILVDKDIVNDLVYLIYQNIKKNNKNSFLFLKCLQIQILGISNLKQVKENYTLLIIEIIIILNNLVNSLMEY